MATIKQICVFCGAGTGNDPDYIDAAETLGKALADHRIRLVYGGASIGLMGALARSTLDHGGTVTGVIPEFLEQIEEMFSDVTELIVTKDLHERKRIMFERADAIVALPGGIGTLEELVEQMTWVQLGRHRKPVVLGNIKDFWQPLIDLLAHMRSEAFIRPGMDVTWLTTKRAEDIVPMILEAATGIPEDPAENQNASDMLSRF